MFEIALAIATVVIMVKVADHEGQPTFLWGALTTLLCIAALFLIPWPFLRVLLAGIVAFVGMIAANMLAKRGG